MNLTLKQLFKFGVVCASACALSATAANVSDSFEAGGINGGSDGLSIKSYKVDDPVNGTTNWYAEASDASVIVTNDPTYAAYSGTHPITGTDEALILSLDTAGGELLRTAGVSFASTASVTNNAYVDAMVQFELYDADGESNMVAGVKADGDVKLALYINANSNLVAIHTVYDEFFNPSQTNSVIDSIGKVDPDTWYRLTLKMIHDVGNDQGCEIYWDGSATPIMHPNALDLESAVNGGSYFVALNSGIILNSVSFQGTGLLDELVVSDTAPDLGEPVVAMLTLFSPDGKVTFSPVGPVMSGTVVTMTANVDWHEIDAVTGPYTADPALALPAGEVTATLSAAADCTVTATVAQVSGPEASWAVTYGVSEAEFAAGTYENNYLLNISTGAVAEIEITTITVVDTNITEVTVGLMDMSGINGTLSPSNSSDLVTWTVPAEYGVDGGKITITNGLDFIKAVVK